MSRKWVINASPLITLAKISQINLLTQLCSEIVIPNGVVEEINVGSDDDPAKIWLSNEGQLWIREVEQIDTEVARWDLGLGESHVQSWVYSNPGYEAILDDRAAKNAALALKIPVRGTLGIILLAKQQGIIIAAKPLFEQLVQVGFRVTPEILAAALRFVNE